MRLLSLFAVAAIIAGACGSRVEAGPAAAPSVPPTAPTETATPRPAASPTSRVVAFPDLPFIVGTENGDLFFQLVQGQPAGRRVHVCDAGIRHLVAYGRQALFLCDTRPESSLDLYDDDTGKLTAIAKTESQLYALTDTGQVVYVAIGRSEPTAPIPMTRLMSLDLRTRVTTQLDERYGVAFEVRLTGEGLMVWRPRNSLAFARPDAETGTWILRGTELAKLSQYRLVEGGKGRDLLETEAIDPSSGYATAGSCCTYVLWRTTSERRLTPANVPNEKALALLEDGRMVTWRPGPSEFDGTVVVYDGSGNVQRSDRGRLGSYGTLRSGDWLVGQDLTALPFSLRAYRVSDGAFAGAETVGISAFAFLGPKK